MYKKLRHKMIIFDSHILCLKPFSVYTAFVEKYLSLHNTIVLSALDRNSVLPLHFSWGLLITGLKIHSELNYPNPSVTSISKTGISN